MWGAAIVGLAAALAWRNRDRIANVAEPWLEAAAERGTALRDRLPWGRGDRGPPTPMTIH